MAARSRQRGVQGGFHPSRWPSAAWPWLSLLWLALICWLAFFQGLGALGLMDKTEALFVEVGHQMLQRDDWVTPWWNGHPFFDYPIWGYWMVALSFRWFGVSEGAARLPVALAASAVVVATFLLLWRLAPAIEPIGSRWLRAALGAGVLATTPGWTGWGRSATTDMFLSSAITLALYGFLLAHHASNSTGQGRLGRGVMALFAGIAVLAKGPVGLLLPALVVVGFLLLSGSWRRWLSPGPLLAMAALFLGVVLPWYTAATRVNGQEFLGGFLGFSNLQRFTSVLYAHPGPPWFYLPWLLLLLFPWSLFLPAAIGRLKFWKPSRWRSVPLRGTGSPAGGVEAPWSQASSLPLFLLLWLAVVVGFFSAAATKLPGYILPAVPAGALLLALDWRPLDGQDPKGWPQALSGWLQAGLLALLAAAAAVAPRWAATDPAHPQLALALNRSGLPLTLAILLALMALALGLLLLRPGGQRWLWSPTLAGFLAILALVVAPLAPLLDRQRQLPLRQLAREAHRRALPHEPLWVVGTKRYSTVFYAGETAAFVGDRAAILARRGDPDSLGLGPSTTTVRLFGDRAALEGLGLPAPAIIRLASQDQQELWRVSLASLPTP
ncbi:MAG: glycosyltransferase family 39 protein [Cyanobium sp. ELA507]